MNILSSIPSFYQAASFGAVVTTQITAVAEQAIAQIASELPTTEQVVIGRVIAGVLVAGAGVIQGIETVYNRSLPKPPRDTRREDLEFRGAGVALAYSFALSQGKDPEEFLNELIKQLLKNGMPSEDIITMFSKWDNLGDIPEKIRGAQASIQADKREHQEQLRESIKAALTNGIPCDEIIARFAPFEAFSDLPGEVSRIQKAIALEKDRSDLHELCMGWTARIN